MASPDTLLEPHAAFNAFVGESILVLDTCDTRPAQLLPGSAYVDPTQLLFQAAAEARRYVVEEMTPDNPRRALLLCDGTDRALQVRSWLIDSSLCDDVMIAERSRLIASHTFIFVRSITLLPIYSNEIVPSQLYLGPKSSANPRALSHQGITHVLSLLDRGMDPPDGVVHKLIKLADHQDEDLLPVMLVALPFVRDALAQGGRVLVHCDRGQSRSASVVAAYFMHSRGDVSVDEALATVAKQRPCVRPNRGFLRQLAERAWAAPLARLELAAAAAGLQQPAAEDATALHAPNDEIAPAVVAPFEYTHGSRKRTARSGEALPQVTADQPEIQITSSWGGLLREEGDDDHHNGRVRTRSLEGAAAEYAGEDRLFVHEHLFSPSECASLVQAAEAVGFGRTSYPKHYRGNLRLITVDTSLADAAWRRLKPHVPATHRMDGDVYDAVGLNECWRLAKYHPADRFAPHVDARYERSDDEVSLYTVNVYMNAVPPAAGGATIFYREHAERSRPDEEVLRVAPEPGLAVTFRQPPGELLTHEGERLAAGVKFLFRTDVMYRRRGE